MLRFLASLKLAVVILLVLAASLAAGTFTESYFDVKTGRYWVYGAVWFKLLLTLLAVNLAAVMADRWPWKRHHAPFLLAHIGIILLLVGSAVTQGLGVDGSLVLSEGEKQSVVELDNYLLTVSDGAGMKSYDFKWLPPHVSFSPITYPEHHFTIDKYLAHADVQVSYVAAEGADASKAYPAVHLRMSGGPLPFPKDFWLYAGDPTANTLAMGPAKFILSTEYGSAPRPQAGAEGQAMLELRQRKNGEVAFLAVSRAGQRVTGAFRETAATGHVIDPKWKMGIHFDVMEWIPHASVKTEYLPAHVQYGDQAPSPAIHLAAGEGGGPGIWLGLGEQAKLSYMGQQLMVAFVPRQIALPFAVQLDHFTINHYDGTMDPSAYSSDVKVVDGNAVVQSAKIAMNEPLHYKGFTFYQASFIPGEPRPTTSVFTVNQDPGRRLKYFGSILLVLGTILLFARRYMVARRTTRASATEVSPS